MLVAEKESRKTHDEDMHDCILHGGGGGVRWDRCGKGGKGLNGIRV
jgi:hypothetical protein